MKKKWEEPRIEVQKFIPNEYVAACWKINCNVPTGYGFVDNNNNRKYDWGEEKLTPDGSYGCGKFHTGVQGVPDDGPTANAMWQPQEFGILAYHDKGAAYDVYYWRDGTGTYDVHFSKVEDAEWETNPNAS